MKILLLRLSSMGDVLLTTPIIRSLKAARPDAELHFLVKPAFAPMVAHHPGLTRVHHYQKGDSQLRSTLQAEGFDHILDLQHSLRSWQMTRTLGAPVTRVDKRNMTKWRMVRLKRGGPVSHIVERYGQTLEALGVALDGGGLDLYIPPEAEVRAREAQTASPLAGLSGILGLVLGASYATKRWPPEHFAALIHRLKRPAMLFGGPDDRPLGQAVLQALGQPPPVPVWDTCGQFPLLTAAALLRRCQLVVTPDTGLMHIGAALGVPLVTLWGNTVPGMGMTPWQGTYQVLEIRGLPCRPCSKLGYPRCPRGHFRCMRELKPDRVAEAVSSMWDRSRTRARD